jgi:hypothetical protein
MSAMFSMQPRYNPFLPHHDLTVSHRGRKQMVEILEKQIINRALNYSLLYYSLQ